MNGSDVLLIFYELSISILITINTIVKFSRGEHAASTQEDRPDQDRTSLDGEGSARSGLAVAGRTCQGVRRDHIPDVESEESGLCSGKFCLPL